MAGGAALGGEAAGGGSDEHAMFAEFASAVPLQYRDYYCMIPLPMDVGTVLARLLRGWHRSMSAVGADIDLIHANCLAYNDPASPIAMAAVQLSARLRALLDEVKDEGTGACDQSGQVDLEQHAV